MGGAKVELVAAGDELVGADGVGGLTGDVPVVAVFSPALSLLLVGELAILPKLLLNHKKPPPNNAAVISRANSRTVVSFF